MQLTSTSARTAMQPRTRLTNPPQDRTIDAGLRNPRCGAALGAGHISGASCDFPTGHQGPHGVRKQDRAIVAECWTCWHSPRAGMITNRPNLCCPRPMVERQHPALLTYNDARLHVDAGHDVRPMREDRCSYCGRKMNGHRICVTCGRATGLDVRPVEGGSK